MLPAGCGGDGDFPEVLILAGRRPGKENAELNGEYRLGKFPALSGGRHWYRKTGGATIIRYHTLWSAWLIDNDGNLEGDNCNAYGKVEADVAGDEPMFPQDHLMWRVWDSRRAKHVEDKRVFITAAPAFLQVVQDCSLGLQRPRWSDLIGEYALVGRHRGRVSYQQVSNQDGKEGISHVIRWCPIRDIWVIDLQFRDDLAGTAYASRGESSHPGELGGEWKAFDAATGKFRTDSSLRVTDAPLSMEVFARKCHPLSMNGSYLLCGLWEGQPAYLKADGSGHAIRFQSCHWVIDFAGLRNAEDVVAWLPAIAPHGRETGTRFRGLRLPWLWPSDIARAPGLAHWHVYEHGAKTYVRDGTVQVAAVPHRIVVRGRAIGSSSDEMNGEYFLSKVIQGKPSYKKRGSVHTIRYFAEEDSWVIDLVTGTADGGEVANAYAKSYGADFPVEELRWQVFDANTKAYSTDTDVISEASRYKQPSKPSLAKAEQILYFCERCSWSEPPDIGSEVAQDFCPTCGSKEVVIIRQQHDQKFVVRMDGQNILDVSAEVQGVAGQGPVADPGGRCRGRAGAEGRQVARGAGHEPFTWPNQPYIKAKLVNDEFKLVRDEFVVGGKGGGKAGVTVKAWLS